MVQKEMRPRPRGRPRSYDPEVALKRATEAFWKSGYSGTSLDDLAAATGMNRPSLYAGFGDKRALYIQALNRYWDSGLRLMHEAISADMPLADALNRVYQLAVSMYFPGKGRALGCFGIGTALTEAAEDAKIRETLLAGLRRIHAGFEGLVRRAQARGELAADADIETRAGLASAVLSSLAVRSRAGLSRESIEKFAKSAAHAIAAMR